MNVIKPKVKPSPITIDPWRIVQHRFDPEIEACMRTIFCQSNGYVGIVGCLEDAAGSSSTPHGSYLAGLYEAQLGQKLLMKGRDVLPDVFCRTAKGFGVVRVDIVLDGGDRFSLAPKHEVHRYLDLRTGELCRKVIWETSDGRQTQVEMRRMVSLSVASLIAQELSIKPINHDGMIMVESWLEADVESFYLGDRTWRDIHQQPISPYGAKLYARTANSGLYLSAVMDHEIRDTGISLPETASLSSHKDRIGLRWAFALETEQELVLSKSVHMQWMTTPDEAVRYGEKCVWDSYADIRRESADCWDELWDQCDVTIEGDDAAQQGVRYCIYQLLQAYREGLPRSVTAKALTGEGYGQLCFWDAEIYLLPFYVYNKPALARQMLDFRYLMLDQARQRAVNLGYRGAMFPWMTVNGEDNPGVWECVLGEVHHNSAIAYAIRHYVTATGDWDWLWSYGVEIIVEIARFWASRVHYCTDRDAFVICQVTGPDEYMEMVNNNCYTNMMAAWTLNYAYRVCGRMRRDAQQSWIRLIEKLSLRQDEIDNWFHIGANMFVPFDEVRKIHLQDDTFLGLRPLDLGKLCPTELPLEAKWPWPKVLEHNALKQADVLLACFLLPEYFTETERKANYEFYEPKTTHDSSLSASIHAIMAAEIGKGADAYDYFMHAARLDLDYGACPDGVHLANAGGVWMAMVFGFAGLRWIEGVATFAPKILSRWQGYAFRLLLSGCCLAVRVTAEAAHFELLSGQPLTLIINDRECLLRDCVSSEVVVLASNALAVEETPLEGPA